MRIGFLFFFVCVIAACGNGDTVADTTNTADLSVEDIGTDTSEEDVQEPEDVQVSEDVTPEEDVQTSDTSTPMEDVQTTDTASPLSQIAGLWGQLQVTALIASLPGTQPMSIRVFTYHLVNHEQNGTDLVISHEVCEVLNESGPLVPAKTVIPEAYVNALDTYTRTGTYTPDVSGSFDYIADKHIALSGLTGLTDPETEELPTSADDPRVFDQDGDGNPGMTVRLEGFPEGDLYIVQRDTTELSGKPVDPDTINGTLTVVTEQVVLASNPGLLKQLNPTAVVDPDPSKSFFTMVRLPENADCAWLVDNYATILPVPNN
ncbi:MAG: hypothetical protein CMH54_06855 [Myxococcales bacterium]|nr:hypothetical protein [Myxococcales bacterium]